MGRRHISFFTLLETDFSYGIDNNLRYFSHLKKTIIKLKTLR